MEKNAGIVLAILLLMGCKNDSTLIFSEKIFEQKIKSECEEYCPIAKLEIALFESGNKINDSINKRTFETFNELLSFDDQSSTASNYDELLISFMNAYKALRQEFPDDALSWEVKGSSVLSYQNHRIVNIKLEYYIYTGGAHGYSGTKSLIFNQKTGETLTPNDIFKDIEEFTFFSEQKFKEEFGIKPNAPINSTGLMFENEFFELPETLLFTEKGLTLFYNTYEIASYADGPQELTLSFDQAQPFLKVF